MPSEDISLDETIKALVAHLIDAKRLSESVVQRIQKAVFEDDLEFVKGLDEAIQDLPLQNKVPGDYSDCSQGPPNEKICCTYEYHTTKQIITTRQVCKIVGGGCGLITDCPGPIR